MCCLVWRVLFWEVGELDSGPKEIGINISHLPGEHPALWLLCYSMRWGRSVSSLLNSAAVHKSVQNMEGRRWNKQGGVWAWDMYIRVLWDLQGLDLPPFVTSGPYLWLQYMSPWNRIRFLSPTEYPVSSKIRRWAWVGPKVVCLLQWQFLCIYSYMYNFLLTAL